MSTETFDDDCPGCRPGRFNPETGQAYPADHPLLIAVLRVWGTTTLVERRAYHCVMCGNSREAGDVSTTQAVVKRMALEMTKATPAD